MTTPDLEFDFALGFRVQRVIFATANIVTGMELGAALTHQDSESRPLRVLPAAFLCAMLKNLCLDIGNFDFSITLTVPGLGARMLTPAEFNNFHLVAATLNHDFGRHRCFFERRGSY